MMTCWSSITGLCCDEVNLAHNLKNQTNPRPAEKLGFAGRESLQLMRDWRCWATTGRLDYGSHKDLHDSVARFSGKVLAISMAGDKYSSRPAEQRALAPFSGAQISQLRIGNDASDDHPGHFAWAKKPRRTSEAILDWLDQEIPGTKPP